MLPHLQKFVEVKTTYINKKQSLILLPHYFIKIILRKEKKEGVFNHFLMLLDNNIDLISSFLERSSYMNYEFQHVTHDTMGPNFSIMSIAFSINDKFVQFLCGTYVHCGSTASKAEYV